MNAAGKESCSGDMAEQGHYTKSAKSNEAEDDGTVEVDCPVPVQETKESSTSIAIASVHLLILSHYGTIRTKLMGPQRKLGYVLVMLLD